MTNLLPAIVKIAPPIYRKRSEFPQNGKWTDLRLLCEQAEITLRYEGEGTAIYIYQGQDQIKAIDAYAVAIPESTAIDSRDGALRALEALAFGFRDYAARSCICGRGLFGPPEMKDEDK